VSSAPAADGAFAPLRVRVFAVLWTATVLGNIGSFMRDVASAWLATDLTASPTAVASVQAAATLPVFLFAIPAGVLADILDPRRFLIAVQVGLACVSAALMTLAALGELTISSLMLMAFLGGLGSALIGPAWQSIVPELVPPRELRSAVTLNALGVNIARAVGPAAGGLLLAAFGPAPTYGIDLVTYIVVIGALVWWQRPVRPDGPLDEHFASAFRAGIRFARAHRDLHKVLARAAVHFAFASSIWALLPLVARNLLAGGASLYGVLLGAIGLGAILGAVAMPSLRARLDADRILLLAALLTAAVVTCLAFAPPKSVAIVLLLVLGGAWILALTTLSGIAQSILPNWVRGRALAIYLMVFNGALALGSVVWGLVAQSLGVSAGLLCAAAGQTLAAFILYRYTLPRGDADLAPSSHWPVPLLASPVEQDRGPVMVTIEYRVSPADRAAFLDTIHRLSFSRLRDGAYTWGVSEDAADPEAVTEWFLVESWAEHARQHARVAHVDADLQHELLRFHSGSEAPRVKHLLALKWPTHDDLDVGTPSKLSAGPERSIP
jgi:MFS family permease